MLLTLQTMLVIAGVEALPEHRRVQVLARRLSAEMTNGQVFDRLRLTDRILLPLAATLRSATYVVPLAGNRELHLGFHAIYPSGKESPWRLRSLKLVDKDRNTLMTLNYQAKK